MKGRTILTALVLTVVLFALSASAFAGGLSSMEQGKKYAEARMWPQAIAALEEEIKNNPKNAEAHFLLGVCYANTGEYYSAEECFDSAVASDKKGIYGHKIGEVWKNAGMFALNKGEVEKAKELFNKAETYQPGIKQIIAAELLAKGKNLAQKGAYEQADRYFSVALSLNYYLGKEICDAYYSPSDPVNDEKPLDFYIRISPYCGMHSKEIGEKLLVRAKKLAKVPGKEKETEKYKKVACQYLGETTVQTELPDYRVYQLREDGYIFKLKAGEQTDHWIMFPEGRDNNSEFYSTKTSEYKLIFDNGDVFTKNQPAPLMLRAKFKIVAVTDCNIKMVVK